MSHFILQQLVTKHYCVVCQSFNQIVKISSEYIRQQSYIL